MILNPILKGFHPDPAILRVGEDYYIATSTFEWYPGIALYYSKDLVNWSHIGYALTRPDQINLTGLDTARGVWAPCLSYSEKYKKFYLTFSVVYNIQGQHFDLDNFVVEADSMYGEWSEAVYINSTGFDPSLFHDDDGRQWIVNLVWENRTGYEHPGYLELQEWDPIKKTLIGTPTIISRGGTHRGCLEAPHIYKRNGYYYLMTAEGGTGYGHAVVISRSRHIQGPYEADPKGVVITSQPNDFNERGIDDAYKFHQYYAPAPLQKAGHGSLVETHTGELYIVHLCARPFAPELRCLLGRETAIQQVIETEDLWIRLPNNEIIAQLSVKKPSFAKDVVQRLDCSERVEFRIQTLPNSFQSYRYSPNSWISYQPEGGLVIRGQGSLFSPREQSLIARRVQSFHCTATTKVSFDPTNLHQSAGLVAYYSALNFYYLRIYYSETLGGKALGIMKSDLGNKQEFARVPLPDNQPVYLKMAIKHRTLTCFYSLNNEDWYPLGDVQDATLLSDEYGGQKFTGSFFGMFVQDLFNKTAKATFEYFDYQEYDDNVTV